MAFLECKDLKPSIITSTETWLGGDAQSSVYNIDGYSNFIPCKSWAPRGGVGIYLDKEFKYPVLLKDTVREWLIVEVLLPVKFPFIATYRCEKRFSKSEFCEWLLEELKRVEKPGKWWSILLGDFNEDILVESKYCQKLMDTLKSLNLTLSSAPDVNRELGNYKTFLDHIDSDLRVYSNSILYSSLTDHYFVYVIYDKNISQASKLWMYRNYKNLFSNDIIAKYHFILMQDRLGLY